MKGKLKEERGAVFVLTMVMVVLASGLLAAMFENMQADTRNSTRKMRRIFALSCSESGVAHAAAVLRSYRANFMTPPAYGSITINGVRVNWSIENAEDGDGNPILVTTTGSDGFRFISKLYKIKAVASYEGIIGRSEAYISLDAMPIFQFVIFYDYDLEVLPGPTMHLVGRVHTNGDLFTGCGGNLWYDDATIRAVGKAWRDRKDKPGHVSGGGVKINGTPWPPTHDSDWTGHYEGEEMDFAEYALARWDGALKTGAHGVSRIEPPEIGSIQPYVPNPNGDGDYTYNPSTGKYVYTPGTGDYDKSYYHENADVVIIDNKLYVEGVLIDPPPSGVIVEKTFFDGREEKYVKTTDIDIEKLKDTSVTVNGHTRTLWPQNGLIYAYRTDAKVTQPNGIRLVNGKELGGKLTVVTPDPLFIWGDFNTVNKKGAAVICDAINLLSNAWDDSKRNNTLPTASNTTYNVAIMSGPAYETEEGRYNGGFENFPRFHERWSGRTAKIRGSFIGTWYSQVAKGKWICGSDNYTPPKRNWNFDPDLLDPDFMPPFTPQAYEVRTIAWWRTGKLPYSIFVNE
ncbi:MAG: hypothetical protein DRP90_01370 [Planctomycetota bacterium]|nr:MAG: hypothetical protein DRP90_01370 [Planctomycetota bacterium]